MKIDKSIDEYLEDYLKRFRGTMIFTEKEGHDILYHVRDKMTESTTDPEVLLELIYVSLIVGFMKGLHYRPPSAAYYETLASGKH